MTRDPRNARPTAIPRLPRFADALLRALLPRAERDEVVADLASELEERRRAHGHLRASLWLARQTIASVPALLARGWFRGTTGFEPRANAMRPGGPAFEGWIMDARFAVRRLRSRPTYAAVAVLTLALGVGGGAAIFSLVRGLLIDPLPYAHEERIVELWSGGDWSDAEFLFVRGRAPGFASLAAYRYQDMTLRRDRAPAQVVFGIDASHELFDVLGAHALLGRTLRASDEGIGAEPTVVIAWDLWQELGGDASVIGSRIAIDGTMRTVVGVMSRAFWFPSPKTRLWIPGRLDPQVQYGSHTLVGRLDDGRDVHAMAPQLAELSTRLRAQFHYTPTWDKSRAPSITPIRESVVGEMRPALLATLAALGALLALACANVAALMLGQVSARGSELAVRVALGASRGRLTQQIVIESLIVGAMAGVLGALAATIAFRVLVTALPLGAWSESAAPDWRVFVAAMTIALLASLLIAIIPIVSLRRGALREVMSRARTAGIGGAGSRLEDGLVVAEVALAVLIACGAALLERSVSNLYALSPGVDTRSVAVLDVTTSAETAPGDRGRRWPQSGKIQLIGRLVDAVRALPGVESAAATQRIPLRGAGWGAGVTLDGRKEEEGGMTTFRFVTPGYFGTMGIALRAGRAFDDGDMESTEPRVVINESVARKYFPHASPLGRLIGGMGKPSRIVGVVADASEGTLTEGATPTRYFLASQMEFVPQGQTIVMRVRRGADPAAVLASARRAVQRVAPDVAINEATTMSRVLDLAVGPARQIRTLLAFMTALALVLGAVGVYGVIAHFASRRRRDWAIRMALGLRARRVVTHVVGRGAGLVTLGIVIGVVAATAMGRLLATFLYGVGGADPIAFGAAGASLLVVGLVASWVPARRASRVDPAAVLREQ